MTTLHTAPAPTLLVVEDLRHLPALLGVDQAAQVAGVTDRTLRRWLAAGLLQGHRMPGTTRIRIRRDELLAKMGLLDGVS